MASPNCFTDDSLDQVVREIERALADELERDAAEARAFVARLQTSVDRLGHAFDAREG
jgi:hypothetical protein